MNTRLLDISSVKTYQVASNEVSSICSLTTVKTGVMDDLFCSLFGERERKREREREREREQVTTIKNWHVYNKSTIKYTQVVQINKSLAWFLVPARECNKY